MHYKAKCVHCGCYFKLDAQGGQRVRCSCPYCGSDVEVWLPEPVRKIQGKGKVRRNTVKILLVSALVIAVGLVSGWYAYRRSVENHVAERMKEAYRKAHRDSLMRIRTEQDLRRHKTEVKEMRERNIGNFIKSFYLDAVLGDDDADLYRRNLTERCREKICGQFGYDSGASEGIVWKPFAPDGDEPDTGSLRRNLYVSHHVDDWYKVRLVQYGHTEYRYVKAFVVDGNVMIDDVR